MRFCICEIRALVTNQILLNNNMFEFDLFSSGRSDAQLRQKYGTIAPKKNLSLFLADLLKSVFLQLFSGCDTNCRLPLFRARDMPSKYFELL